MEKCPKILKDNESTTPSKWREKAEWRRKNKNWLRNSQRIALAIMDRMDDLGINQKELAEKMIVKPQYISKVLKGSSNLSLKNISGFEKVLDINLISILNRSSISHYDTLPEMVIRHEFVVIEYKTKQQEYEFTNIQAASGNQSYKYVS